MHFSKVTERGPKKETWHVFPDQDEFPLHTTSGPVPRFYLLLHQDPGMSARGGRHAALFQSLTAVDPSNGFDFGKKSTDHT